MTRAVANICSIFAIAAIAANTPAVTGVDHLLPDQSYAFAYKDLVEYLLRLRKSLDLDMVLAKDQNAVADVIVGKDEGETSDVLLSLVANKKHEQPQDIEYRLDLYVGRDGREKPVYHTQPLEKSLGKRMHRAWVVIIRRAKYPTDAGRGSIRIAQWFRCIDYDVGYRSAVMPAFAKDDGELAALGWVTLWACRWVRSDGADFDAKRRFPDALGHLESLLGIE